MSKIEAHGNFEDTQLFRFFKENVQDSGDVIRCERKTAMALVLVLVSLLLVLVLVLVMVMVLALVLVSLCVVVGIGVGIGVAVAVVGVDVGVVVARTAARVYSSLHESTATKRWVSVARFSRRGAKSMKATITAREGGRWPRLLQARKDPPVDYLYIYNIYIV